MVVGVGWAADSPLPTVRWVRCTRLPPDGVRQLPGFTGRTPYLGTRRTVSEARTGPGAVEDNRAHLRRYHSEAVGDGGDGDAGAAGEQQGHLAGAERGRPIAAVQGEEHRGGAGVGELGREVGDLSRGNADRLGQARQEAGGDLRRDDQVDVRAAQALARERLRRRPAARRRA